MGRSRRSSSRREIAPRKRPRREPSAEPSARLRRSRPPPRQLEQSRTSHAPTPPTRRPSRRRVALDFSSHYSMRRRAVSSNARRRAVLLNERRQNAAREIHRESFHRESFHRESFHRESSRPQVSIRSAMSRTTRSSRMQVLTTAPLALLSPQVRSAMSRTTRSSRWYKRISRPQSGI